MTRMSFAVDIAEYPQDEEPLAVCRSARADGPRAARQRRSTVVLMSHPGAIVHMDVDDAISTSVGRQSTTLSSIDTQPWRAIVSSFREEVAPRWFP